MQSICRTMALIILATRVGAAGETVPQGGEGALADLVIHGADRPIRLRIGATRDDVSWQEFTTAARSEQLQSLFQQLDADANGRLAPDEARRLPRPEALGRTRPLSGVNVAFNFRVLDGDGDGAASLEELQAYLAEFSQPGPLLGFVESRTDRNPGDLFPALDFDRNRRLTVDEWSAFMKLLDRDRDGNRVLTPDELRSPAAELFGPEFLALPIGGHGSGLPPPLTAALEPPGADEPDGVVSLRLSGTGRSIEPAVIDIQLSDRARDAGIEFDSTTPQRVRLRIRGRYVDFSCAQSGPRGNAALSAALLRQFDALAERLGRPPTTADDLPVELKSAFAVADADGNGDLERAELERCIAGFVAATASSVASRLSLMFVPERRGLSPLIDDNRDGRLSIRELQWLAMRLSRLIDDEGTIGLGDMPLVSAVIFCQGAAADAVDPAELSNAGPPWFVRADRNSDGDLDAGEFVGPPEIFARLDANGDGWVELAEALRVDESELVPAPEARP